MNEPTTYKPDERKGIYLALTPDRGFDGSLVGLDIHLVNGLDADMDYHFDLELDFEEGSTFEGEIPSGDLLHMEHLYFAQLNGNPSIFVECTFMENSKSKTVEKVVRLKPKVIHNGPKFSALINEDAFVYEVYIQRELPVAQPKPPVPKNRLVVDAELLKLYMTETNVPAKDRVDISEATYELDLHFDALVHDETGWNGGEKLQLQLDTFRQKLDSAIANGLHSMVVIHGVGSGRLKEEVGLILSKHPKVKSFGPCLHRKYGFGATEVFF